MVAGSSAGRGGGGERVGEDGDSAGAAFGGLWKPFDKAGMAAADRVVHQGGDDSGASYSYRSVPLYSDHTQGGEEPSAAAADVSYRSSSSAPEARAAGGAPTPTGARGGGGGQGSAPGEGAANGRTSKACVVS